MFLSLDGTFIAQLINFAIFFALLRVVFIGPVGKAITERRRYINSVTSDYEKYQSAASALRAQAESVRAAARREAEAVLAKSRADASNEAAAISTQYAEQARLSIERANATVDAEMESARAQQPQLARELANLVVQRTLTDAAS